MAQKLEEYSRTVAGADSQIIKQYAQSLEVIPYTLAENSGLNPIQIVTELRTKYKEGKKNVGLNAKKGCICENMTAENVIQPTLVTESVLKLSTEVVKMILKIDDIVYSR